MKRLLLPLALLLSVGVARAESIAVGGNFRGLNNGDSSILIDDSEAQDLENVDITPNGYGIAKRSGTVQYKTINVSTSPVRGGYFFRDAGGNDEIIHANDRSVCKSVAGGEYSCFYTTATLGTYWQFTDSNGTLYGANSAHDPVFAYNGTTLLHPTGIPLGSLITMSPDRLIISGVSANPNRVYFSGAADLTNFTVGNLETSPFYEDVGLPGQNITAIKYAMGRLIAWTNNTMSFFVWANQFDGSWQDVSLTVGCNQPDTVVFENGNIYFQGSDGHFYQYDGNSLTRLSQKIAGSVANFPSGQSKAWAQTEQTDFQAGTLYQTSATIIPGAVVLSTWSNTDTTSQDFSYGVSVNVDTTTVPGQMQLSHGSVPNSNFESGTDGVSPTFWEVTSAPGGLLSNTTYHSGTMSFKFGYDRGGYRISIYDKADTLLNTYTYAEPPSGWSSQSVSLAAYNGLPIKVEIDARLQGKSRSGVMICDGTVMSWYVGNISTQFYFDDFSGGAYWSTGTYLSQSFDTQITSPSWTSSTVTYALNGGTITFQTQVSDDNSSWDSLVYWATATTPSSGQKRYMKYKIYMATTSDSTGNPNVQSVSLFGRSSTGSFTSQYHQANSNISSWGNFNADDTLNGGNIYYLMRSSNTLAGMLTQPWTAVTKNSQIGITVNPYFQVKATFTVTAGTQTPTLSNFTVNWNEGAVVHHWGTHDKDHRLMWAVLDGAGTYPNKTYIFDPRFNSWLKYSVPFQAAARYGDSIYYGGVSTGVVYMYPSGTSDLGSAVSAYWKSKDYLGGDGYVEKDYLRIGLLSKAQTGSSIDLTYTVNTSTAITNIFSLTDSNGNTIRRINYNLPSGKYGNFINYRFGNNASDAPFEVYGFKIDFTPRPWRVMN